MERLCTVAAAAVLAVSLAGCRQFPTNDETSSDAVGGDAQAESDLNWRYYPGTSDDDTREIVCWGDSMTQGVGADTDVSLADGELYDTSYQSYPQVLSQLTGLDTYNFGVAGATSAEVAAMQGGLTWEELEAAEQSVEVADADDADANDADDAADADVTDDANATDDAADADDADDQPVSHIDPDVIEEGERHTGDILVLEIGSNGGWNNDYQVLIDQYRAMIERSGCEDYLILGDTDDPGTSVGDTSQVPFTEDYAPRETNWEAALREAFGDHFINMRVFLIKHGLAATLPRRLPSTSAGSSWDTGLPARGASTSSSRRGTRPMVRARTNAARLSRLFPRFSAILHYVNELPHGVSPIDGYAVQP